MRKRNVVLKKWALLGAVFFVASCESGTETGFCAVTGDSYLQNGDFSAKRKSGALKDWNSSQHAGENSFELDIDGIELTIDKIGTQPWFMLRQRLPAKEVAGKKIAFTAEIKLDLRPPVASEMPPIGGGLQISARDRSGGKPLLSSTLDHEPRMGKTDWQAVQVVIQVPARTRTLELGFLHQADGSFSVRDPSLKLVDETTEPCELSPGAVLGTTQQRSQLR
jgi:hypothetical protein